VKIKIVFFVSGFNAGGKERRCLELLKSLKNLPEYSISIISLNSSVVYPEFYSLQYPFYIISQNERIRISVLWKLLRLLLQLKPDIVHCWSVATATYSSLLKPFLNFRLVNSQISDAPQSFNWNSRIGLQTRFNYLFSEIILSNSAAGLKAYNAPAAKSQIIYNGIDLHRFQTLENSETMRKKLGIITDFVVCMIASFSERKDFDTYFEAAEELLSQKYAITFLAVGSGKSYSYYSHKYSENPYISLTGQLTDIESVINLCDIGVLMTNGQLHGEGISNSIIEYMALAKPVIASQSGGTAEIIDHNITGYIIADKSKTQLKEKIVLLKDNPELARSMGQAGKNKICNDFTIEKMSLQFQKIFNLLYLRRTSTEKK